MTDMKTSDAYASKNIAKKVIVGSKNVLYINFFFSCLKMVNCKLMLLELSVLLWCLCSSRSIFYWLY